MLPLFIIVLNIFYLAFNLLFIYGWKRAPKVQPPYKLTTRVSIIITVRNEERNIFHLLADIEKQSYPKDLFEIIIVNDHSEDSTSEIVTRCQSNGTASIQLLHLKEETPAPKKTAINLGVQKSSGDLILITDGDCRVGERWIESMAMVYEDCNARFIAGPVTFIDENNFLNKLLIIEFSSLIGAGAALLNLKRPVMCNAANLAFDKVTFLEVNGFSGNEDSASGDDVFLMRKIFDKYPQNVVFNKDVMALVQTFSESSLKNFYYQRVRWAGKWRKMKGIENRIVPVLVFVIHASFLIALALLISGEFPLVNFAIILLVRFLGEYLFLYQVMKFSNKRASIVHYFVASLAYPFYAVLIGVAANISGYYWKGRKYIFK